MSTIPGSPENLGVTTNRHPSEPRNIAAYSACAVIYSTKFFGNRDILPEPLDITDHFSNTMMTLPLAASAAILVWRNRGDTLNYREPTAETDEEFTRRKKIAAAAALGTTVVVNVFAETIGYGEKSIADPIDFAYGIMGGAVAYLLLKPKRLSADEIQLIHASEDYQQNPEEYADLDKLVGHTPPPKPKSNSHHKRRRRKKNRSKKQ